MKRFIGCLIILCLWTGLVVAETAPVNAYSDIGFGHLVVLNGCAYFTKPDPGMSFIDKVGALQGNEITDCYTATHIIALVATDNGVLVVRERKNAIESVLNVSTDSIKIDTVSSLETTLYDDIGIPKGCKIWDVQYQYGNLFIRYLDSKRVPHIIMYDKEGRTCGQYENAGMLYETCFIVAHNSTSLSVYDMKTGNVFETNIPSSQVWQLISTGNYLYYTDSKGLHRYEYQTHTDRVLYECFGITSDTSFVISDSTAYILNAPDNCCTKVDLYTLSTEQFYLSVFPQHVAIDSRYLYVWDRDYGHELARIDLLTYEECTWKFR